MKCLLNVAVILSTLLSVPVVADNSQTVALVEQNRYPLKLVDGQLSGEGGERLAEAFRIADIAMFGENHGMQEIAALSQAMYVAGIGEHPPVLVTEVGPATAVEVERMLRDNEYRRFLTEGINLQSVPFFSMEEDIPLLELALAANPDRRAIIGLDQEFMAGAPLLFNRLERLAANDAEREAVATARRAAYLNPFLLGMGDGEAVRRLNAAFADAADPHARQLAAQLALTHRIYREQMGGDAAWSNERRETLMFENFLHQVSAYGDAVPPMFLRFGGYHLFRYRSPTVKEAALGLRVSRWADERDLQTVNVFVDCVDGEALEALLGGATECDPLIDGRGSLFEQRIHPEGMTLFDLRPLRDAAGLDELHWSERFLIKGYDYLLLVPRTTASSYAAGTLVLHRYGMIAAGILLSVLVLLVWGIVIWRRRRRTT